MKFIFKTTTTMKEYNNAKYWIGSNIVPEIIVTADSVKAALEKWREKVGENYSSITVSKNALKTKEPMFVDTVEGDAKQVGYVITGCTEILLDDCYKWVKQYVDLWVTVITVVDTEF